MSGEQCGTPPLLQLDFGITPQLHRILIGCGGQGSTGRSRKRDRGPSVGDDDGEKQVAPIHEGLRGEQILPQRLDLSE